MRKHSGTKRVKKSVKIPRSSVEEEHSQHSITSMQSTHSIRPSRGTIMGGFTTEIAYALELRKIFKAVVEMDGEVVNVTPKPLTDELMPDRFKSLRYKVNRHELLNKPTVHAMRDTEKGSQFRMGGFKVSMEDIITGVEHSSMQPYVYKGYFDSQIKSYEIPDDTEELEEVSIEEEEEEEPVRVLPFLKVKLRKTEVILLYKQQSTILLKHTEEAALVEADNRAYDYITIGKGKLRRLSDADAQTTEVLYKSRESNTTRILHTHIDSYVSNFEMYDTLEALSSGTYDELKPAEAFQTSGQHTQKLIALIRTPNFKLSNMIMKRVLAANVYEEEQRRFRNMNMPDPLSMNILFRYTLRILFKYMPQPQLLDNTRKAVTDLSWCAKNGDILAVGYGIYSFSGMHVPNSGYVCVWSIKNPDDPERCYNFHVPVVTVEFSPFLPTLLAVGLYDGSVEVFDITNPNDPPIAISQRSSSPSCEAVMAIKWISHSKDEVVEIEPFLALSQDGSVTKYRVINSPHLLGFQQMVLERVEGRPEGLHIKSLNQITQQANRHPQGLNLTLHPLLGDIYYILTDEGCLHKCSTNYPHQHLEVWQAHEASVNCMDFSPWSPKLFLTCGNDWCVRVWLDGVFKPLLTLKAHKSPVHCAYWSRTHSTIIIAMNRVCFDIWDIHRNILQPVSSTKLDSSYNTLAKFARCGRSVAVGNERGKVIMCAFDDFPFPPHFQFEELETAIYKAISTQPDLVNEVKTAGLAGYPQKGAKITY